MKPVIRLAVLIAVFAAAPASAQIYFDYDCTLLSEQVRRATFRQLSRDRPTRNRDDDVPDDGGVLLHICDDTTLATTSGFSAAAAQLGMPVRWSYEDALPYCSSMYLSQCYPFPDPAGVPLTVDDQLRIASAWRAVSGFVTDTMTWGIESDLSYFRD